MEQNQDILKVAERLFYQGGFNGTGMDRVVAAAGVSSRTLYKHIGGKAKLIAAVLRERDRAFWKQVAPETVEDLFEGLRDWFEREGALGCMFLRAIGEGLQAEPEIAQAVHEHKAQLLGELDRLVRQETGRADLVGAILLLYEGAVAAAVYRGAGVVDDARRAARELMKCGAPR